MSTAKLEMLRDKLAALLCDEDLTDEKLREASEGLLPNIYDALAPPDPRKDLAPSPELLQLLKDSCDRDWKDESPEVIIRIACNALYWRDYEIAKLREGSDNYQRGYDDAHRIYERRVVELEHRLAEMRGAKR